MSSAEIIRQNIESIKSSSSKEMYEEKAEIFFLNNADGEFKNFIYGQMEPTFLLEYINNIHSSKRDEIERKEKESKFTASRMLVTFVFSLENGFFDLLNGLVSFGQIRLVKKIMEKIESNHGSISSSQMPPDLGSILATRPHSSHQDPISSSQMLPPDLGSIQASGSQNSHQDSVSSSQMPTESGSILASGPHSSHDSVSSPQMPPESGSILASRSHSSNDSVSSPQMPPESGSILASGPHSSHHDSVSSSQMPPESGSILASRPHSLTNIFHSSNDLLSDDDVEKLMNNLLNQNSAKIIIEKLQVKSPRVHQLIHNPVFLKLVAMLINEDDRDVWTYVTTSKLFYKFIEIIKLNAHHEYGLDVDGVKVLYRKLAEMAFEKTKQGSIVFEWKDLERYGLSGEELQDFLFKFILSKQNTVLPFGPEKYCKFRQKFSQEFFTAFAAVRLPVDEFQEFVGQLFPGLEKDEDGHVIGVGEDLFAILRALIIEWVDEMKTLVLDGDMVMRKKEIFLDQLGSHLQQLFVGYVAYKDVRQHQKQMMVDIEEFHEADVCREIKEQLKDVNFLFNYSGLDVAAHREAFSHSLQHFTTKAEMLHLNIRDWKDEEVRRLFQSIQLSTAKIEEMWIVMNPQGQFDVIDHVITSFPHFTRRLWLWLCGVDDDRRRFCRKLKEEINNFDTSKLQTQMLEVKVDAGFHLHVELHRGESPRIIETKY